MKNPVIPFPGTRSDRPSDEDDHIHRATQDLAVSVAADPVPERLRVLAAELGQALDARQADLSNPERTEN